MKRGLLLMLALLVLSGTKGTWADEGTTTTVTIICSSEHEVLIEAYVRERGESMEGNCFSDIINPLRNILQTQGISLSLLQYSPDLDEQTINTSSLEMYVLGDIHGDPILQLFPYLEPKTLRPNSILSPHMDPTMGFFVSSYPSRRAVTNLIAGILFYLLDRCDLAQPYLDEAANMGFLNGDGEPDVRAIAVPYFYRGNCALEAGDYLTAKNYFEAALPADYDSLPELNLHTNFAWTLLQLGEESQAFGVINRAVQLAQEVSSYGGRFSHFYPDALTRRAQLYALAFRYDEALADMDAAIELDPTNPELYVLRGQITLYLYEWDRVLADYNRAIELDPDYADAYYFRGILFYTQGYREDALADFEHYLDLAPDGDHAADAAQYVADIQRELEALN